MKNNIKSEHTFFIEYFATFMRIGEIAGVCIDAAAHDVGIRFLANQFVLSQAVYPIGSASLHERSTLPKYLKNRFLRKRFSKLFLSVLNLSFISLFQF